MLTTIVRRINSATTCLATSLTNSKGRETDIALSRYLKRGHPISFSAQEERTDLGRGEGDPSPPDMLNEPAVADHVRRHAGDQPPLDLRRHHVSSRRRTLRSCPSREVRSPRRPRRQGMIPASDLLDDGVPGRRSGRTALDPGSYPVGSSSPAERPVREEPRRRQSCSPRTEAVVRSPRVGNGSTEPSLMGRTRLLSRPLPYLAHHCRS